jgi:hypothetical protein
MATSPVPASPASLAFVRPSRHAGSDHVVQVDSASLRPLSCTCLAGQHGRLCWAVVDVAARDLQPIAHTRWAAACGYAEIEAAARVLVQVRKWAHAARELQALRPIPYIVTDRGRSAVRELQGVGA